MPGPRLAFPQIVEDDQNGHWMTITPVGRGNDFTPQAYVTLFIPGGINGSNMVWQTEHEYQDAKLSRIVVSAASQVPIVGTALGAIAGAAPMAGGAINPKVEVLYRDTNLRKFQFSFIMAPSSPDDSQALREIVKTLRKFSSPTLVGGAASDPEAGYIGSASGQGSFLSTGGLFESPYEFLIKFYYKDSQYGTMRNLKIPRIGRCVMEHIDINYTPQGEWSTFHDGMPTSAMLTMVFREMRIIDSQNVEDGF
jgi:hypothetical protein